VCLSFILEIEQLVRECTGLLGMVLGRLCKRPGIKPRVCGGL